MKGAQGKNSRRTIGFGAAVSALIVVMGVSQPSGAHANASGTAVSAAVTALRTTFSELAAVDAAPVIVPNAIVASPVVPSPVVPTSAVPTPAVPTSAVPTSAVPTPAVEPPAVTSSAVRPTPITGGAVPAASVDCHKLKCVALTFDDGPGPYTNKLLNILKSNHAPATFFVLGESVQLYPADLRREAELGMEIGTHTWDHRDLTKLDSGKQAQEANSAAELISTLTGHYPTLLRPPFGAWNPPTRKLGYAVVLWDVDTEDWRNRSTATTTNIALRDVRPGSIVLMHDIYPSTVDAVPGIIRGLRERGYTLVTVSQLVDPQPGGLYYSR